MRTLCGLLPVLLSLTASISTNAWAQSRSSSPEDITFERITLTEGLSAGQVRSIVQDEQGFLWIATGDGLNKYDGYGFTIYRNRPGDSTSISYNWIQRVFIDRQGTLWAGTFGGGLNRFDPDTETFSHYRHDEKDPRSLSQDHVTALFEDTQGTFWVGTQSGGLNRFDRASGLFTRYQHDLEDESSLSSNEIRTIYEDRQGTLWIGTGEASGTTPETGGLNRFDRATETFTRYLYDPDDPSRLIDNRVQALYEDTDGVLWVGTCQRGLHRFNRETETFTRVFLKEGELSRVDPAAGMEGICQMVTILHEDPAGAFWVGIFGSGLARWNRATGTRTTHTYDTDDPQSLGSNDVWSLFEDRKGTLWVSTLGGGLARVASASRFRHAMHHPDDPASLSHSDVAALHIDQAGTLWVGTFSGLNKLVLNEREGSDPSTSTALSTGPAEGPDRATGTPGSGPGQAFTRYLPDDKVEAIVEDRSGQLWVGTQNSGLLRFDQTTGQATRYLHNPEDPNSLRANHVSALLEDRSGRLWVATWGGGLHRFDRTTGAFTSYLLHPDKERGQLNNYARTRSLYEDHQGTIWIGSDKGFGRFDEDAEVIVPALDDGFTVGFLEDRAGRFWVIAPGVGLLRFDRETGNSTYFTAENGLPSNVVLNILEDDAGFLWLSANGGLSRFDPDSETFRNFGISEGLQSVLFNPGSQKSAGGTFFFATPDGLLSFSPDQIGTDAHPPDVVLTGLRINNETVEHGPEAPLRKPMGRTEEIRLSHAQKDITFEYVALHYTDPARNQYQYRLDPYDEVWIDAGTQRLANYTNLDPGTYTFRVKAAGSDGLWNEQGASVRLMIAPPWWQTWWAYGLYGLLLVAGIFVAGRGQQRRLLNKERERVAAERMEQIRLQNERLREIDEMKTHFLANISHEFRTPLTLTFGPLQDFLSGRFQSYEQAKPHFERALRNGRSLLWLINQLLDLSRIESGALKLQTGQHDLKRFLSQTSALFESLAASRGITLQVEAPPHTFPHGFDADLLENAVVNLLANAFKFTPDGGTITVHLRREADGQACIEVADTGEGIAADHLPYLFDRFYQVDGTTTRKREGAGIGLSLVKELVALHGGTITVESKVGIGTRFMIHLPNVSLEAAEFEQEEAPAPRATAGRLAVADIETSLVATQAPQAPNAISADATIVLLVEDNADMRAYLRDHLKDDFEVVEAEDGKAGLAKAYALVPDLVLSDVMMPEMDGLALCKALKQDARTSHVPVILLTAKADVKSRISGFETGADAYLPKPFSAEELQVRVRSLIEQRRALRTKFSRVGEAVLTSEPTLPSQEEAFLKQVQQVVEARLSDASFGVEALAEEMGMSQRQLLRKLRALTEETSTELIWRLRLEQAAHLLQQNAKSVKEVAFAVGFKYEASFSRSFRKVYGVSPSDYAEQADQDQAGRPG